MLDNYVRNKEQFKILANTVKHFRTADLYKEFDDLGNYFNNVLSKEFEKILNTSLIVEFNKFLSNVGNGKIEWVDIIDIIDNNSIPFNKLQKIPSSSVLCTDEEGKIIPIVCNIDFGILFGRYKNTHIWRKLLNEDIKDQSITGNEINILDQINLAGSLINDFLSVNILETKHFTDGSITSDKIKSTSLDSSFFYLSQNDQDTPFIPDRYKNVIGVNNLAAFSQGFLDPSKIMDKTILPIYNPQLFSLREYSNNKKYLFKDSYEFPENPDLNVAEILESYNIVQECLEDDHLIAYQDIGNWENIPWYDNYNEPRYFQQGYIDSSNCKLEGRCIPHGTLRLRHFSDEVRQALIAKGVTDDD